MTIKEVGLISEDDIAIFETGDETTPPIEEKTLISSIDPQPPNYQMKPVTSSSDGGVHIHVEQKALQTIFDKIPWEDLVDSFNNKLTHKQEIRFNPNLFSIYLEVF